MGVLQVIAGPLSQQFSQLGTFSQIGVAIASFLFVAVALNVLQQFLFKKPNEPPLVFHWFPIIGSTITYGMDPPRFFKENREKVRDNKAPFRIFAQRARARGTLLANSFALDNSMAIASPSSCSERRLPSTSAPRATISS